MKNNILHLNSDKTRNIRAIIARPLREFPRAKPEGTHKGKTFFEFPWALPLGTPSGKGLYFTVSPELSPNTNNL